MNNVDPASLINPLIAQWGAFAVIFLGICFVAYKLGNALIASYEARLAEQKAVSQMRSDDTTKVTDALKDMRGAVDTLCKLMEAKARS